MIEISSRRKSDLRGRGGVGRQQGGSIVAAEGRLVVGSAGLDERQETERVPETDSESENRLRNNNISITHYSQSVLFLFNIDQNIFFCKNRE